MLFRSQQARGDVTGVIATARELEDAMRTRRAKMRANDERICTDSEQGERRQACLAEVRKVEFPESAAELKLRELAARLQQRGPQ